ncbi:hypothetical protein D9757_012512 [Collybiopsis confluens]|uniref:Glutathione S-transferase n=1 Tax=Collybiopsis confluens TaxID=2823264 RepID=A0A8H5FWF0_9AGAR|nr:hypothetical protein D9757_012512 [Collybiopsis confluens]
MSESKKHDILLYTSARSPNAMKIAVFTEELKSAYGFEFERRLMDMSNDEQKEPWYIAINPNGRIPALVDRSRDNFAVFESAAILLYLQEYYDPDNKFGWDVKESPNEYTEMIQWMLFAHGGIGPAQGQLNHFRHASEKIPYAIDLFTKDVKSRYAMLDKRMDGREYLAGPGKGMYSIADINVLPWIRLREYAGIPSLDEWPNLKRWYENTVTTHKPTWDRAAVAALGQSSNS